MSDFPWIASDSQNPQTQEIKDPVSGVSISLPKMGGLTVNEVLFAQWAAEHYDFFAKDLTSQGQTVLELADFCHKFLCLRLGLADWGGDDLSFDGEAIKPQQSLAMALPTGQQIAAPLFVMYLIYGFFFEERAAWLGEPQSQMMSRIAEAIAPQTGPTSTGNSSEHIQDAQSLEDDDSGDASLALSSQPPGRSKKPKSQGSATKAA